MDDPLGIRGAPSRVAQSLNDPMFRAKLSRKFQEMRSELQHIGIAVEHLSMASRSTGPMPDRGAAARAKQDLKNWLLSLVESYAYLDNFVSEDDPFGRRLEQKLGEAVRLGNRRAVNELLE